MTAQIAERFTFEGQEYRLLCAAESLDFDLAGAGLALAPEDEILRLAFGAEQGRFLLRRLFTANKTLDADLPLDYTGQLLLCRGLLHRYYSEAPWSYQESLELVFEDGFLREAADAQPLVRAARELLFAPERQDDLYALAERHWWLRRCLGLSGSPADAPKIAVERTNGEHF